MLYPGDSSSEFRSEVREEGVDLEVNSPEGYTVPKADTSLLSKPLSLDGA